MQERAHDVGDNDPRRESAPGELLTSYRPSDASSRTARLADPLAAASGDGLTAVSIPERKVFRTARYRRTVRATGTRALVAVADAVDLLRYPRCDKDPAAAEIRFSALGRTVTARVIDTSPEASIVEVELASLSWLATGGSALVILPGVLLGAAMKAQDAYFAKGFLVNVQRVLEGKRVRRDSARLFGMNGLWAKLEITDR